MRVLYDLFPAYVGVLPANSPIPREDLTSAPVTAGARQVATCRVIVTDQRIIIATDSNTGPLVVFNEAYDPNSPANNFQKSASRNEDSRITTISGKILAFKRDNDCGCGSRLRSWNPYRSTDSSKDPTE